MRTEFIEFEDDSQKGLIYIKATKTADFYELGSELLSVPANELQNHDSFEIHKKELLALADWILKNVK